MAHSLWGVHFLSCVILSAEVFWVILFSFLQEVAVSFSGSALSGVGTFFLLLRDRGLARYLRAWFDSCYGRTSAPRRGTEVVSSACSLASCTAIGFDRFVDLILCSSCECRGLRWYQSEARRTGLKQSSLRLTEVTRSLGDLISCVFESSTRGSSAFSSEDCPATPIWGSFVKGL